MKIRLDSPSQDQTQPQVHDFDCRNLVSNELQTLLNKSILKLVYVVYERRLDLFRRKLDLFRKWRKQTNEIDFIKTSS